MSIDLRAGTDDDFSAVTRLDGLSFAIEYDGEDLEQARAELDLSRFTLAEQDTQLVGVAGSFALSMTVPGGRMLGVPGVTWVSVAPTHRRRGVLRALMGAQLGSYAEQGLPAAVLTASEGGIYRRFGYGPATVHPRVVLDRRDAQLSAPVDTRAVRFVPATEAAALIPPLYERWRALVPGAVSRSPARWAPRFADRPGRRGGGTALYYLIHPDGYLAYRAVRSADPGRGGMVAVVEEYAACSAPARAALWQVLLQLDLFDRIETTVLPVDDPLPHLLRDARQMRIVDAHDGLWIRLLDVGAALAARTYGIDVDVVIEVHDDGPVTGGTARYRLRGGVDGAVCERTDALPDVTCDVSTLGSVYLGGHRLSTFLAAGRIEVARAAPAARLDLALLAERAPCHGADF